MKTLQRYLVSPPVGETRKVFYVIDSWLGEPVAATRKKNDAVVLVKHLVQGKLRERDRIHLTGDYR